MSSEDYEIFRHLRDARRKMRHLHGVACPDCLTKLPRANPTILLPGQRCKIHGYRDPRPYLDRTEVDRILAEHGIFRLSKVP